MVELQELFDIQYGTKLDLNKLIQISDGVPFVSRTSKNNGVSAKVRPVKGKNKLPAGSITVSLGGTKLLSSFVQSEDFYTAQNVAVLIPKEVMTLQEKLFICLCIEKNRFRYSAFGREANRTIKTIKIPSLDEIPDWARNKKLEIFLGAENSFEANSTVLNVATWNPFRFDQLFDIKKGKRLTKANMLPGNYPFIGSTDKNNGVTNRVGQNPNHPANVITVNYNGSVGEAFYQPVPFLASDDVNVLYPKESAFDRFNQYIALFIIPVIRHNRFKFSYGRKWHLERMEETLLYLPVTKGGKPDLDYMESYIKKLPFSKTI
ncbi:restriction endonuclease subunit S [Vibrio cholerae]|uniref:restriction endonuclease subunit S n=1 Tax=Vibrio cholerae TaxID=666 RepID=UPI000A927351|nr:restriction endonuclease subunit S [Vibrio cholerae]GHX07147.1 restriction endonuclease [Vibrio cholerae]